MSRTLAFWLHRRPQPPALLPACLQMMEVVRLQGAPSEADSIGELVWVLDELSGCWWPAELLDPFNLPVDRQLPKGAIAGVCHTACTGHRPHLSACGPLGPQGPLLV